LEGFVAEELAGSFGGCYPGTGGIPCASSRDCFANLICATVPPDGRSRSDYPQICTTPCGNSENPEDPGDADCPANPWFGKGYCVPVSDPMPGTLGYCRAGAHTGRQCDKDTHCWSLDCQPQEDGSPSQCK
jgi:hypothetical protein